MRKEVNGEKFIQADDLVFINENDICHIPSTLWNKVDFENLEKDIKLVTEDELSLFDKTSETIYLINDLDKKSLDELYNLKEELKKQSVEFSKDETKISIRQKIRRESILNHKIDSISEVIKLKQSNSYLYKLNPEIKKYFTILSKKFPDWLLEYINTPALKRLGDISQNCGTDYTKCLPIKYYYSVLDHSVGVALIIWRFTHDRAQTLAGLFHDISTPAFKHCVDFMNGDLLKQESTEEQTEAFIKNSKEIMSLLKRDRIKLEDVSNYKKYPIADNELPKLSADRLEYGFSAGLTEGVMELSDIEKAYNDISILTNELGNKELGFKSVNIATSYIDKVSRLWPIWISDTNKTVMQFYADILRSMISSGYLTKEELYTLGEKDIMQRILTCEDTYLSASFYKFLNATKVYRTDKYLEDVYCVKVNPKKRYVDPLIMIHDKAIRISDISSKALESINNILNMEYDGYTYMNVDFTPYKNGFEYEKK